jgi:hypothetical protein
MESVSAVGFPRSSIGQVFGRRRTVVTPASSAFLALSFDGLVCVVAVLLVSLVLEGVYRLADIINRIVSHSPGSAMSELLRIIFKDYKIAGDLKVDLAA